jgi:hypothetical protein
MKVTGEQHWTNSRDGKRVQLYDGHNRAPGLTHYRKALRNRYQRRTWNMRIRGWLADAA